MNMWLLNFELVLAPSFHLKVTCSSQSCSFNHLIVDLSPSMVKLLSKSSRLTSPSHNNEVHGDFQELNQKMST